MTDSDRIAAAFLRWNATGDWGVPVEELSDLRMVLDESGASVRLGDANIEHFQRLLRFLER